MVYHSSILSDTLFFFVCGNRKKYVKSCQIRHTYGEDEESNLLEEEAILVSENAVQAGVECDTTVHRDHVVDPPETATVTLHDLD